MIVQVAGVRGLSWIAERANLVVSPTMRAIEALDETGAIRGAIAYDGWTPNSAHLHVALETPIAARKLLRPTFRIPFEELGLGVLFAPVFSTNPRSLRLLKHLGFRIIGVMKDGWEPGTDIVMHEMRREECRYLEGDAERMAA